MRESVNTPSTAFDLDDDEVDMVKRREESVSLAMEVVTISLLEGRLSDVSPVIWNLMPLSVTMDEI